MRLQKFREPFIIFGLFVLAIMLFVIVLQFGTYNIGRERKDVLFGVTFSTLQAEQLGLDWQTVYLNVLDDLKVELIRIPIYWNDVEPEEGIFEFDDYHWMMSEAARRDVEVIPVLGMRVPRWPECHVPKWAENKEQGTRNKEQSLQLPGSSFETTLLEINSGQNEYTYYLQSKILRLLEREVNEFKRYPNIRTWQIENEPLLDSFGVCPFTDLTFLEAEFSLVRKRDPSRRVMGTESGELSDWIEVAGISDVLGASLYRVTFNPYFGFFYYPIPPFYYQKKVEYVSHLVDTVIISELQTEPWVDSSYTQHTPKYLRQRFPLEFMKENVSYARKTNVDSVLLWGVEWWMYMKQKGVFEYWDYARTLF